MNPRVGTVGTPYFLQIATNIDCSLRIFHYRSEEVRVWSRLSSKMWSACKRDPFFFLKKKDPGLLSDDLTRVTQLFIRLRKVSNRGPVIKTLLNRRVTIRTSARIPPVFSIQSHRHDELICKLFKYNNMVIKYVSINKKNYYY